MKLDATRLVVRDLPYRVRVLPHAEAYILIDHGEEIRRNVLIERIGSTASVYGTVHPWQTDVRREPANSRSLLRPQFTPDKPFDIYVPLKTPLAFSGVKSAAIGAIEGSIQLVAPPSTSYIAIECMNGGSIVVGGGRVEIGKIAGEALSLTSLGMGTITVKGGEIEQLTGIILGNGAITFTGTAQVATLALRGNGAIDIARVIVPFCTRIGRGTIRIGDRFI